MREPILVTYATRLGSTADVAERIVEVLRERGETVDLRLFEEMQSLKPYKAVVLGSAIRAGKWLPEAVKFVETHRAELSQRPTAFFMVCMTLHEDTPANRAVVADYLTPVLRGVPEIHPVSIGMFAGKVDLAQMPFVIRTMFRIFRSPEGDWRDWEAIEAWARGLAPVLNEQPQTLPT